MRAAEMFAPVVLHIVGPQFFILAPVIIQALVAYRGLSAADANALASIEGTAKAIATIALAAAFGRVDWRQALRFAVACMVAGNVLAAVTDSYGLLVVARSMTGLATGVIVPVVYAAVALTGNPERNFGILMVTVMSYGALGFGVASQLTALAGVAALYWAMAGMATLSWPLIRRMPQAAVASTNEVAVASAPLDWPRLAAVIAVFLCFAGYLAFWVNAGLIGTRGGLDPGVIGTALSLSQAGGIGGALIASVLGARIGRRLPLSLGIGSQLLAILLAALAASGLSYTLALCLFVLGQNLTHPFLLGTLASLDRSGRMVAMGTAAQMIGIAAGPALAAALLSAGGSLLHVQIMGAGLLGTAILLLLTALSAERRVMPAGP